MEIGQKVEQNQCNFSKLSHQNFPKLDKKLNKFRVEQWLKNVWCLCLCLMFMFDVNVKCLKKKIKMFYVPY